MTDWMPILATQIWTLPYLALYILGLVFALSRRDMGRAASFAAAGFALHIVATLMGSVQQYLMISMRSDPDFSMARMASLNMALSIPGMVCRFAGLGLLMAAIFVKRPPASERRA